VINNYSSSQENWLKVSLFCADPYCTEFLSQFLSKLLSQILFRISFQKKFVIFCIISVDSLLEMLECQQQLTNTRMSLSASVFLGSRLNKTLSCAPDGSLFLSCPARVREFDAIYFIFNKIQSSVDCSIIDILSYS